MDKVQTYLPMETAIQVRILMVSPTVKASTNGKIRASILVNSKMA